MNFRLCSVLVYVILLNSISVSLSARANNDYFCPRNRSPLSTDQLRKYYGQEKLKPEDGRNCDRACDGTRKICYFNFVIENFNTMAGSCGDCGQNVTADCFKSGCIVANGIPRNVMVVNRQVPGPAIHVCRNDEIVVDVQNRLSGSSVTIHWHGLHQTETPWMDGVPMVTQCPIHEMNTFRYVFNARQAGTFYWHAHTGLHRTDGIIGALDVRDNRDPNAYTYNVDVSDHSILITDWTNILAEEFAPGVPLKPLGVDSVLINGFGCFNDISNGRSNCGSIPIAVFYMEYGKASRIRFDNAGSQNCPLEFTIKGLRLTVIASDSFSVVPVMVDSVTSSSGERFDVVVNAPINRRIRETYIRVRATGNCGVRKIQTFARIVFVENRLHYTEKLSDRFPHPNPPDYETPFNPNPITLNEAQTPCTVGKNLCIADLEQNYQPYSRIGNVRYYKPDREIPLNFSLVDVKDFPSHFIAADNIARIAHINNIVSGSASVPGLTQDDSTENYCNANKLPAPSADGFYFCTHLLEMKWGEMVDLMLHDVQYKTNTDLGSNAQISHPFHIHGFGFEVIDMGTREQFLSGATPYRYASHNPPTKDTISVPRNGFARLRLRANNPGYWFFHCHFEWHLHVGMGLTVKVGEKSDMIPPPKDFPKCGNYLPDVCRF